MHCLLRLLDIKTTNHYNSLFESISDSFEFQKVGLFEVLKWCNSSKSGLSRKTVQLRKTAL